MSNSQTLVIEKLSGKRLFDVIFSLFVLALCLPLFLFISLAIRLSSSGPIFFIQYRLGKDGKIFKCYKFRTMSKSADKDLEKMLNDHPHLKKEWDAKQKLASDPRIFLVGHFLRKTSLDELPQFWNVLKGELSVVGPRPYMLSQEIALGCYARSILSVRPGITGIWQTSGRSQTSFQERILLDALYVNKRSFLLDLFLIVKTIPVIFSSNNAC